MVRLGFVINFLHPFFTFFHLSSFMMFCRLGWQSIFFSESVFQNMSQILNCHFSEWEWHLKLRTNFPENKSQTRLRSTITRNVTNRYAPTTRLGRYITSHDQPTGRDLVYSLIDNLYTDFCKRLDRRHSCASFSQELPLSWRHTLSMELRFYWLTHIFCLQSGSRFRSRFPSQKPRTTFHVVGDINFFSSLCANVGPVICFFFFTPFRFASRSRRRQRSAWQFLSSTMNERFFWFPLVSLCSVPWANSPLSHLQATLMTPHICTVDAFSRMWIVLSPGPKSLRVLFFKFLSVFRGEFHFCQNVGGDFVLACNHHVPHVR